MTGFGPTSQDHWLLLPDVTGGTPVPHSEGRSLALGAFSAVYFAAPLTVI